MPMIPPLNCGRSSSFRNAFLAGTFLHEFKTTQCIKFLLLAIAAMIPGLDSFATNWYRNNQGKIQPASPLPEPETARSSEASSSPNPERDPIQSFLDALAEFNGIPLIQEEIERRCRALCRLMPENQHLFNECRQHLLEEILQQETPVVEVVPQRVLDRIEEAARRSELEVHQEAPAQIVSDLTAFRKLNSALDAFDLDALQFLSFTDNDIHTLFRTRAKFVSSLEAKRDLLLQENRARRGGPSEGTFFKRALDLFGLADLTALRDFPLRDLKELYDQHVYSPTQNFEEIDAAYGYLCIAREQSQ